MAFFIYSKTRVGDEWEYHYKKHVALAGGGLIQSACRRYLGDQDCAWTIWARDMLTVGGLIPEDHALVVDTSPSRPTVSLFEITSISGYSYRVWTPIMLTLEQLFADTVIEGISMTPDTFKACFKDGTCERHVVRTILYLIPSLYDWNP